MRGIGLGGARAARCGSGGGHGVAVVGRERRVGIRHVGQIERAFGTPGGGRRSGCGGSGRRRRYEAHHVGERGLAVERGVEVRSEGADGLVEFGREHETGEAAGEVHAAAHHAETEHHGHGRHAQGGDQVEHGAGEGCHLERSHRGDAEALAHLPHGVLVAFGGSEGGQGVDAAQGVDEVVRHALVDAELRFCPIASLVADEDHEEDDDREAHRQDNRCDPVEKGGGDKAGKRHDDHPDHLGQDDPQVVVDLVHALERARGDGGRALVAHEPAARVEDALEQVAAQAGGLGAGPGGEPRVFDVGRDLLSQETGDETAQKPCGIGQGRALPQAGEQGAQRQGHDDDAGGFDQGAQGQKRQRTADPRQLEEGFIHHGRVSFPYCYLFYSKYQRGVATDDMPFPRRPAACGIRETLGAPRWFVDRVFDQNDRMYFEWMNN